MGTAGNAIHREPWNKGKIVGQEAPFKLRRPGHCASAPDGSRLGSHFEAPVHSSPGSRSMP